MQRNQKVISDSSSVTFFLILANAIVLERGLVYNSGFYWLLLVTLPMLFVSLFQRH